MNNEVKTLVPAGLDAAGTKHELLVCGEEVTATMVTAEHGYDDYDLQGQPSGVLLRRICVPHTVKHGDRVNVYYDESSKRGAAWRGSLQKTLEGFVKEPGHEADLRRYVCAQCQAGGADRTRPEVCHQCGARGSFRYPSEAASIAGPVKQVERRDVGTLLSILMQDVVGDYDDPAAVPEWTWVERNASFAHCSNGSDGVHEFALNLARTFTDVPAKLQPLLDASRQDGFSYLLFHQGT